MYCASSAVNSDYILKGLTTFSLWFVYKYTGPTCWQQNDLKIVNNELDYRLIHYSNFSFNVSPAHGCICKQTTHIQ